MAGIKSRSMFHTADLDTIINNLFSAIAAEGYPLVTLDSIVTQREADFLLTHVYINAGSPLIKGEVFCNNERFAGSTDGVKGETLTAKDIEEKAFRILDEATGVGFTFASVTVKPSNLHVRQDGIGCDLAYEVQAGSIIRVADVRFPGVKQTRESYLLLESRYKRGDLLTRNSLQRAAKRLNRLDFIDHVDEPVFTDAGPGLVIVNLPVTEKRVNRASGILSTSSGSGKIAGELRLSFGNLFGTGRSLRFAWLGSNPDRSGIELYYREPWILRQPIHLDLSLEQWSEDSISTQTLTSLGIEWEAYDLLMLLGQISQEYVSETDTSGSDDSEALWLSLGAKYEGMDSEWNPSTGISAVFKTSSGKRQWKLENRETRSIRKEVVELSGVEELRGRWLIFGKVAARDVSGSGIIREDLVRIGGSGSLRGYAEESLMARGVALASLELRWRPDRHGYAGLFCDAGRIYRIDERIPPGKRWPLAYGLTSNLSTNAGLLGLDLGLAAGESFRNARIHIRLSTVF